MRSSLLPLLGVLFTLNAAAYRIAVLNDFHADINYNATGVCIADSALPPTLAKQELESQISAPLGRLLCDPPMDLFETFLKKIQRSECEINFLILPGDMVAHGIPLDPADPSVGNYDLLKKTLQTVADTVAKYFPNLIVIPTFGNNDSKYHYQGLDTKDKEEYYSVLYNAWFQTIPKNSKLSNLNEIKQTFQNGGYYRVDIDSQLSVLATNTLYFNKKNDPTNQGTIKADQIAWLKAQLSEDSTRKFIITNHIYPGAKFDTKSKDTFDSSDNTEFFDILQKYSDKIIIEVSAHDHFADVRYHSDGSSNADKQYFHNMIVAPGVSPVKGQNPGFAIFEIDQSSLVPNNLEMIFLPLEQTYGWTSIPSIDKIPFRQVNFSKYGLTSLDASSLKDFKNNLEANDTLAYNYLVSKLGFDSSDTTEYEQAMSIYVNSLQLLTSSKRKTYKFICQMHLNKDSAELDACIATHKSSNVVETKFLSFM